MCLFPKFIPNPRYRENKQNGGNVPRARDTRLKWIPAACGNCIECRQAKAREWQVRLNEELRENPNAYFMTMTFSDKTLLAFQSDNANEVASKAVELFRKRWYKKFKKPLRHWLITELGHGAKKPGYKSTERIHLHGFIWTTKTKEEIERVWQYGWIDTGECVSEKSISYCVKYVSKMDPAHEGYKPKIFASKGLGKNWIYRYDAKVAKKTGYYRTPAGYKLALPIYYRNKLFTAREREDQYLEKLNANIRYVCGQKIFTRNKKEMEDYFKTVEFERQRSYRTGYTREPWSKKDYKKNARKNWNLIFFVYL